MWLLLSFFTHWHFGSASNWFNAQTQKHDIENSTRNNVLAAVSDLLAERASKAAAVVILSITRVAAEAEIEARKLHI